MNQTKNTKCMKEKVKNSIEDNERTLINPNLI